jgi:hypothetical protein
MPIWEYVKRDGQVFGSGPDRPIPVHCPPMQPDQLFRTVVASQFEASLCMLHRFIERCPEEHWEGPIAKYPFWMVAYHTLCFVDYYLSRGEADFRPRVAEGIHPKGMAELEEEYPSRTFGREELLAYSTICREKLASTMASETPESLGGGTGFSRLTFTRAELHLYNMRHIQHHAGQLGAFLRRLGVDAGWVKAGWK